MRARSCRLTRRATRLAAIKRKEDFKQNVAVYQAALYLEITEVLTTIGGLLNMHIDAFERQPWSFDDMSFMLLTLPRDCAMVNRLIEKVALTRRRGNLDQVRALDTTLSGNCGSADRRLNRSFFGSSTSCAPRTPSSPCASRRRTSPR